ncbi:NfeD family protein [Ferrigenium sp. UT5]|uniref:NfeD family protein n=1 Tax=Ferrigenium sp. UT5 TaxID=3242105 RepID=UPI00354E117E
MEAYWIWWLVALALVIAEMFSGTFYLLAVALGLVVAGFSAYFGTPPNVQGVIAAVLCTASVGWIYGWKKRTARPDERTNLANDIGQEVNVVHWADDHNLRVSYRGAEWQARLAEHAVADRGRRTWRIKDIAGSCLIVE